MNDRPRTQAVYVISVAAELSGMHPQTLRIYERRGLLSPARTQGGNRRYSDQDIAVLKRIAELTGGAYTEIYGAEGVVARIAELPYEERRRFVEVG